MNFDFDPETLALIYSLLGALLAWGFSFLYGKLKERPDWFQIESVITAIAAAATANHALETNEARLKWAVDRITQYLKAKGLFGTYDPTALAEYGHVLEQLNIMPRLKWKDFDSDETVPNLQAVDAEIRNDAKSE